MKRTQKNSWAQWAVSHACAHIIIYNPIKFYYDECIFFFKFWREMKQYLLFFHEWNPKKDTKNETTNKLFGNSLFPYSFNHNANRNKFTLTKIKRNQRQWIPNRLGLMWKNQKKWRKKREKETKKKSNRERENMCLYDMYAASCSLIPA